MQLGLEELELAEVVVEDNESTPKNSQKLKKVGLQGSLDALDNNKKINFLLRPCFYRAFFVRFALTSLTKPCTLAK